MTQISFHPTTLDDFVDWNTQAIWSPAEVPNGADDDVTIGAIYSGDYPYTYFIKVGAGQSYAVRSIDLQANYLLVDGALSVTGDLNEGAAAEIDMEGGTLTAGTLELHGYDLQGNGTVNVTGTLTVDTMLDGTGLTVTAANLALNGTLLAASGGLTVITPASGFAAMSNGVLNAGTYEAIGATLLMNVGEVPTVDAADIDLIDGSISFYNPAASAYASIQSTLTTIASGGKLEIGANVTTPFGDLTDNGVITLDDNMNFNPAGLLIGAGGEIDGAGEVVTPVVNNGLIDADHFQDSNYLVVDAPVTGSGHFVIDGDANVGFFRSGSLELKGPQSQDVVLPKGLGTLTLDDPAEFTGRLVTGPAIQGVVFLRYSYVIYSNFEIRLPGVDYNSITSYSYRHTGASGVLTIDTTAGDYSFAFEGNLNAHDFRLSDEPQVLSTLPPVLDINVGPQFNLLSVMTPSDFAGEDVSDVLWRNANGQVTIWNVDAASPSYASHDVSYVSDDWQIAGVGDFNGARGNGVLWRNANGDVTTWNTSPSSPESFLGNGGPTYWVSADWQIAGVGDFNGDGLSDVLWRNTNGDVDIWNNDGGASFSAEPLVYVSTDWQIAGVGDFNGAGKDGILWRNANSGDVTAWNVDPSGAFAADDLGVAGLDWTIAGVGNFNGDLHGQDGILLRNANGEVNLWTEAGSSGHSAYDLGYVSTDWQIEKVGDYNGDGLADILWRNANSGVVNVWYGSSSNAESSNPIYPPTFKFNSLDLGYVSADWQIVTK